MWQVALNHGNALPRQHALVHNARTREQNDVTGNITVGRNLEYVPRHEVNAVDLPQLVLIVVPHHIYLAAVVGHLLDVLKVAKRI